MKINRPSILAQSVALAYAGSAAMMSLPATAADVDPGVVQVVEVTAQSRHQLVSDVPITIDVITAKDIETVNANNLGDLNGYIPGFTADNSEITQPTFTIRGVQGGGDFGIGTDSPVGIYEDGVYTGKTGGAMMNFLDVQRIEVIKGPQGTLFGRNSAAGAISVVTNEPSQELDALAHYTGGSFGTHKADVMLNAPLTDDLAVRFVLARNGSKGWVTNETFNTTTAGDDDWAGRLSFRLKLGAAKAIFSWEHEELNNYGSPAWSTVLNPAEPLASFRGVYDQAYVSTLANPLSTPLYSTDLGIESRKFDGLTLRFETPVGGDMTFNSTTGYRIFSIYNLTDNSGSNNIDSALSTLDAGKSRSLQQEFKLSGKTDKLDWIGGVSYFQNSESQTSAALTNTGTIDTLNLLSGGSPANTFGALFAGLGAAGVPGLTGSTTFPWNESQYNDVDTKSWAMYGDTIWHLDPATNLTFGLRFTEDKKTMTWYTPPRDSTSLDQLLNAFGGYVPPPAGPITPASFPQNIIFATAAQLASTPVTRSKSWTNFSPRLVLDHKYDKDTLVYASLSQGYQAGGFNVFTPPNPASTVPNQVDPSYSPEKMTNLEFGLKKSFPEYSATLNSSVFAYRFNNLQSITLTGSGLPGSIPTYNVTTSDQKALGLDLDGRYKPIKNLTLFGGMEYIDATYTKYDEVGATGVTSNLSGQAVGTPLFTGMAGGDLKWRAFNGQMDWTLQGNYTGQSRRCADSSGVPCLDYPNMHTGAAQTRADTRIGWMNSEGQYGVSLVVTNLFDKRYVESLGGQLTSIGVPYATVNQPRFVGVTVTVGL